MITVFQNSKMSLLSDTEDQLLKQMQLHMESNIIATFLDLCSVRNPIFEALFFINLNKNRLTRASKAMYEQFADDGELLELENAEADWYREFLWSEISQDEISQYIKSL